jgi:hypothetical protein
MRRPSSTNAIDDLDFYLLDGDRIVGDAEHAGRLAGSGA